MNLFLGTIILGQNQALFCSLQYCILSLYKRLEKSFKVDLEICDSAVTDRKTDRLTVQPHWIGPPLGGFKNAMSASIIILTNA